MNIRFFTKIILGLVFAIFAIKPYNIFCNNSNKCEPFYLEYIFKKSEGTDDIKINFVITNYIENLDFTAAKTEILTVSNRVNSNEFIIKNNSNDKMEFSIELASEPDDFRKKINLLQCVCSQKYTLKAKEEKKIKMKFIADVDYEYLKSNPSPTLFFVTKKKLQKY